MSFVRLLWKVYNNYLLLTPEKNQTHNQRSKLSLCGNKREVCPFSGFVLNMVLQTILLTYLQSIWVYCEFIQVEQSPVFLVSISLFTRQVIWKLFGLPNKQWLFQSCVCLVLIFFCCFDISKSLSEKRDDFLTQIVWSIQWLPIVISHHQCIIPLTYLHMNINYFFPLDVFVVVKGTQWERKGIMRGGACFHVYEFHLTKLIIWKVIYLWIDYRSDEVL